MFRDLRPNQKFAHYQLQQKIGEGGMGVVYRAVDLKLQRTVAIKFITSDIASQQNIERFLREARAMAQLDHPSIIKIYEVGVSPAPFIAMEFVDGKTLKELIHEKLPHQQLVEMVVQVAQALRVSHQQNIVHRDIKPANIMVGKERAVLMDFGLAKSEKQENSLSQSGAVVGSAAYMPPEQVKGDVAPTNDIYSLGAVLYEGLTGMPPFQGDNYLNILSQLVLKDPVPPRDLNPDISIYLEAICLKCLHKKPHLRYQDARSLERDLANFLKGRPIVAKPYTTLDRWKKLFAQHKILFSVIAFFMTALTITTVIAIQNGMEERQANLNLETTNKELYEQIVQLENSYQYSIQEIIALFGKIGVEQPQLMTKKEELANFMVKLARFAPPKLLPTDKEVASEFLLVYFQTQLKLPGIDGVKLYEDLAKKSPFVILYVEKQSLHRKKGEFDKALEDCQKMLQLNERLTHPYFLMALTLFYQGKYQEALDKIYVLLDKNSEHQELAMLYGRVLFKLNRYDEAIDIFTKKIKESVVIDPNLYYLRSFCYGALKQYDQAIADCKKAVEIDSHFLNAYQRLGDIHEKEGRYFVAAKYYQKYIDMQNKDHELVFYCYGKTAFCLFKLRKFKRAIRYWRKALENPLLDKATAKNVKEKIAQARKLLRRKERRQEQQK